MINPQSIPRNNRIRVIILSGNPLCNHRNPWINPQSIPRNNRIRVIVLSGNPLCNHRNPWINPQSIPRNNRIRVIVLSGNPLCNHRNLIIPQFHHPMRITSDDPISHAPHMTTHSRHLFAPAFSPLSLTPISLTIPHRFAVR